MNLSQNEFDKLIELETSIFIVHNLSKILFDYDGDKEILIDILSEKTSDMQNKLNDFTTFLVKN